LSSAGGLRSTERTTTTRGSRNPERAAAAGLSPGLPSPGAAALLSWSHYRQRARQEGAPPPPSHLGGFSGVLLRYPTRAEPRECRFWLAFDISAALLLQRLSRCAVRLPADYRGFRSAMVRPCRWSSLGRHGVVIGARKRNPSALAFVFAPV
jgi:hypothetical protein